MSTSCKENHLTPREFYNSLCDKLYSLTQNPDGAVKVLIPKRDSIYLKIKMAFQASWWEFRAVPYRWRKARKHSKAVFSIIVVIICLAILILAVAHFCSWCHALVLVILMPIVLCIALCIALPASQYPFSWCKKILIFHNSGSNEGPVFFIALKVEKKKSKKCKRNGQGKVEKEKNKKCEENGQGTVAVMVDNFTAKKQGTGCIDVAVKLLPKLNDLVEEVNNDFHKETGYAVIQYHVKDSKLKDLYCEAIAKIPNYDSTCVGHEHLLGDIYQINKKVKPSAGPF